MGQVAGIHPPSEVEYSTEYNKRPARAAALIMIMACTKRPARAAALIMIMACTKRPKR